MGGCVGLGIMRSFLGRRAQFHQSRLVANITPADFETQRMIAGLHAWFMSRGADSVTAQRKALAAIYGLLQRHATMMAFVEAFWVMAVMFLMLLPFLCLLRYARPKPHGEKLLEAGQSKLTRQDELSESEPAAEVEMALH